MLAELMVSIYFDKRKCLLIRLPLPGLELTERLRIALEGAHIRRPTRRGRAIDVDAALRRSAQLKR